LTTLKGLPDTAAMTNIPRHMQALWLQNQRLELRNQVLVPSPGPGEALIRVHKAGICTTDLELCKGYSPFTGIPGHEFVGTIVAAPAAPECVGRRVVGDINISCGACAACRSGRPKHCLQRRVLGIRNHNGAMAQYLVLPLANTVAVPTGMDDDRAVFAEPLAAALQVQTQAAIAPQDRVLVIGAGMLGQLIARTMARIDCQLVVMARHPRQQQLLASAGIQWMAETTVEAGAFDVVIEATGNPQGFLLAQKAVRPAGTIVLKSTYHGSARVDLSSLVVNEITLLGSRCGSMTHAVKALSEQNIDPTPLIEARYSLGQALKAFEHAEKAGALKILIEMPA
jgi:threonine dehydrogenase-like Zn-dependent dehydrogenase